ncbi:hypothetical protein H4R99_000361 [Coemansia sp. RSA 1722]|nr:hypothetical protein LPJ57_003550 [Coemansia sp. RSA 486]KAJ2233165.1 hypothetical protein IWW45_004396 [Coemansia sp. RSA 485]KAJ2606529.1 hypothetical protein H4R99_000361 [Coemansia sp. RSA 1722]
MPSKAYIKPAADLAKRKLFQPLYFACKAIWKTKTEMIMIGASAEIRSRPEWEDELDNKTIREQWISNMKDKRKLTDKQAAYVIAELFYYAKLQAAARSCGSDAKLSEVDMLWYTDIPEKSDLVQEFNASLSKMLEKLPKAQYCRPPINKYDPVLKQIVDPSLYSLVYESTPILPKPMTSPQDALHLPSFGTVPGSIDGWRQAVRDLNAFMTEKAKGKDSEQLKAVSSSFVPFNEKYLELADPAERHWLPTDIYVNQDGSVDFKSYINNIHPEEHADMYVSISKIISKAIPLLEQALTDWEHPRDLRIPYDCDNCLEFPIEYPTKLESKFDINSDMDSDMDSEEYDDYVYYQAVDKWIKTIINTTPDPEEFVEPERPFTPYSLRNKNLQVVVEITDKDMISVSDTAPESIIATAVYYYKVYNEKSPSIQFLEAVESEMFMIDDAYDLLAYNTLFGICTDDREDSYTQPAGEVDVKQGRLICYPNVYKHNSLYSSYDSPKRLTIYFVDPSVRIVSTAIVPPQQKHWWTKSVSSVPSRVSKLPLEVQDMIFKHVDSPMSFEKACEVSEKTKRATFLKIDIDKFDCYVFIGDKNYFEEDSLERIIG